MINEWNNVYLACAKSVKKLAEVDDFNEFCEQFAAEALTRIDFEDASTIYFLSENITAMLENVDYESINNPKEWTAAATCSSSAKLRPLMNLTSMVDLISRCFQAVVSNSVQMDAVRQISIRNGGN